MGVPHERRPSVLQGEGGDAVGGSCGASAPPRWRLSIRPRQARPPPHGRAGCVKWRRDRSILVESATLSISPHTAAVKCATICAVQPKEHISMPNVVDYEEVKASFPDIFEYVSGKKGVVTVTYGGKAAVRISPINVFRTTEPLPELAGQINCDLFADESSEWESA